MRFGVKSLLLPVIVALGAGSALKAQAVGSGAPASAPVPDIVFASDADARALVAKAKAGLKAGQAMAPPLPLVRVPGFRALVEYRVAPTPASSHDNDAEIMTVLDGSGTLIIGGTLTEPRRPNPTNWNGTNIVGGTAHKLARGSFMFVPKGVPHYFAQVGSDGLSVVTMHIPTKP